MTDTTRIYNLLKEVFFLIDDGDRQLFGEYNLSVPRFYILWHLGSEPGTSSRRLSELMICDKSNITRLTKGLEADGLVIRQRHESDGRTLRLYLTEEGKSIRERALKAHNDYNEKRFVNCSSEGEVTLQQQLMCLKQSLMTQLYGDLLGGLS